MNFLSQLFNTVLYQPLLNLLILLYVFLPGQDFGVAVIVLTLIIKLILYPTSVRAIRSQKALSRLQPKIKEIQEKYKNDRQAQSKLMMELYRKEKINPFSGCLPLFLQLPILIALYQVFLRGLKPEIFSTLLYGFVPNPRELTTSFLGMVDLSQPNFVLAILAGVLQFLQSKISSQGPKGTLGPKGFSSMMQSQMLYFFPILTFFIVWKLGSIIGLYWVCSTLFSIGEHYIVKSKIKDQK
ncbi:MAG: YidC/Oxa1 family membrane protein insertase [Patescibacteria group bacterium]|nr:YidC/Oxa1 family membrane protein insertase [Patescibacteria group bacterium]